jgi:hypothetical protein
MLYAGEADSYILPGDPRPALAGVPAVAPGVTLGRWCSGTACARFAWAARFAWPSSARASSVSPASESCIDGSSVVGLVAVAVDGLAGSQRTAEERASKVGATSRAAVRLVRRAWVAASCASLSAEPRRIVSAWLLDTQGGWRERNIGRAPGCAMAISAQLICLDELAQDGVVEDVVGCKGVRYTV